MDRLPADDAVTWASDVIELLPEIVDEIKSAAEEWISTFPSPDWTEEWGFEKQIPDEEPAVLRAFHAVGVRLFAQESDESKLAALKNLESNWVFHSFPLALAAAKLGSPIFDLLQSPNLEIALAAGSVLRFFEKTVEAPTVTLLDLDPVWLDLVAELTRSVLPRATTDAEKASCLSAISEAVAWVDIERSGAIENTKPAMALVVPALRDPSTSLDILDASISTISGALGQSQFTPSYHRQLLDALHSFNLYETFARLIEKDGDDDYANIVLQALFALRIMVAEDDIDNPYVSDGDSRAEPTLAALKLRRDAAIDAGLVPLCRRILFDSDQPSDKAADILASLAKTQRDQVFHAGDESLLRTMLYKRSLFFEGKSVLALLRVYASDPACLAACVKRGVFPGVWPHLHEPDHRWEAVKTLFIMTEDPAHDVAAWDDCLVRHLSTLMCQDDVINNTEIITQATIIVRRFVDRDPEPGHRLAKFKEHGVLPRLRHWLGKEEECPGLPAVVAPLYWAIADPIIIGDATLFEGARFLLSYVEPEKEEEDADDAEEEPATEDPVEEEPKEAAPDETAEDDKPAEPDVPKLPINVSGSRAIRLMLQLDPPTFSPSQAEGLKTLLGELDSDAEELPSTSSNDPNAQVAAALNPLFEDFGETGDKIANAAFPLLALFVLGEGSDARAKAVADLNVGIARWPYFFLCNADDEPPAPFKTYFNCFADDDFPEDPELLSEVSEEKEADAEETVVEAEDGEDEAALGEDSLEVEEEAKVEEEQETDEDDPDAHPGVSCDACGVEPISGTRFKCAICDNYDLCSSCHEAAEEHHPEHDFITILKDGDYVPPVLHEGVSCDNCGTCPLVGSRWKCADCDESYDLCSSCHETAEEVHPSHDWTEITTPLETEDDSDEEEEEEESDEYKYPKETLMLAYHITARLLLAKEAGTA